MTDTQGSVALQWFQIAVLADTQQTRVIPSVPGGNAYPNVAHDGEPLTYALINNPDGSQPPRGILTLAPSVPETVAVTGVARGGLSNA